jgi:hypothetical protein
MPSQEFLNFLDLPCYPEAWARRAAGRSFMLPAIKALAAPNAQSNPYLFLLLLLLCLAQVCSSGPNWYRLQSCLARNKLLVASRLVPAFDAVLHWRQRVLHAYRLLGGGLIIRSQEGTSSTRFRNRRSIGSRDFSVFLAYCIAARHVYPAHESALPPRSSSKERLSIAGPAKR